jgi:hypothetical protein
MAGELTVIYTARTLPEAYQLQSLLAESGIQAVVSNESLKGGLGGDVLGWSAQPCVAVAGENAGLARQIAIEFDQRMEVLSRSPQYEAGEVEPPTKRPEAWPRCPRCGALRITRCPICQTPGTDCAEVDPEFAGMVDVEEGAEPISCGCGSGGCRAGADGAEGPEPAQVPAEAPPRMLLCPTCDDPFVPQYARRCESCGHEYADGYAPEPERNADERISARAIAVTLALVALLVAMVVYFALLL